MATGLRCIVVGTGQSGPSLAATLAGEGMKVSPRGRGAPCVQRAESDDRPWQASVVSHRSVDALYGSGRCGSAPIHAIAQSELRLIRAVDVSGAA